MLTTTEEARTQNNHYRTIERTESGLAPTMPPASQATPRFPTVTYRVQFNGSFTFDDARRRVGYLHMLGVSDCYASPYFKARADSSHGYDIADHNALNPAIGDETLYAAFVAELHARGMGQVLDIVPNHMGIGERGNGWWMDVLENGPSSLYAPFFDIDWHPIKPELENKVLLPILGQQYGRVLEDGELKLRYEDGAFFLYYYQHELPINPRTYTEILAVPLDQLIEMLGPEHEQVLEYQSIMTALGHLPPRTETDRAKVIERHREKEIIKRRLATLCGVSSEVCDVIEATVRRFNGVRGDPRSFDLLDALIDRQAYRPSSWRVAAEEINYRRFFDINDLAAIRMERSEVFEATHRLIVRLLAEGKINGLRIDHSDGLWDPAGYFRRLQECYAQILDQRPTTPEDKETRGQGDKETSSIEPGLIHNLSKIQNPDKETRGQGDKQAEQSLISDLQSLANVDTQHSTLNTQNSGSRTTDHGQDTRPLYIVIEKILGRGERLPSDWAVHGTTGYEFLNTLNGIFVDGSAEKRFTELYASFTGQRLRFEDLVYESKKQIMRIAMASELSVLAYEINRISERNRYYRDFTLNSLHDALREVIACFTVYRTYIVADSDHVEERDRTYIETAIARAKRRNPTVDPSIYDFLRDILLLEYPDTLEPEARDEQRTFVMKFQQITGPVMAKGVEDTAFYIYNRLVSLNEVGGDPQRFGTPLGEFHRQNQERQRHWSASMLATSTHDTKRAEDVRARINVLSELPDTWRAALIRWSRLNRNKKIEVDGRLAPDRNEEYLFYQTLLGAWPFETTNDQRPTTNDIDRKRSSFVVRRAHPKLYDQGDSRGQGQHQLAEPEHGLRRGRALVRRRRPGRRVEQPLPGRLRDPAPEGRALRRF
jgi:(1->4)-alpha-D-glucan 1-alpha-D-glucosylmutase